jgi:hypothetical protein
MTYETQCLSVILIHRHGARMPNKYTSNGNIWPENAAFWEVNKSALTPTGTVQANNLGKYMKDRYPDIQKAKCITTNTNRTIMTAWSFYDGMLPNVPIYFTPATKKSNSINIIVDIKADIVGHGIDNSKQHINNIISSPEILSILDSAATKKLIGKIYKVTKIEGFRPNTTIKHRVRSLISILNDIKTYISTSQTISDDLNVSLTDTELDILDHIKNIFDVLKFTPYDGGNNDLAADIVRPLHLAVLDIFKTIINNDSGNNNIIFNSFSCHDTDLLAMASTMGIILDKGPDFMSYFLFELIIKDNQYMVAAYYNHNSLTPVDKPKHWHASTGYLDWSKLPVGYFTFPEFENVLTARLSEN